VWQWHSRGFRQNFTSDRFRSTPPPPFIPHMTGDQMLWSIIGANAVVFVGWQYLDPTMMVGHASHPAATAATAATTLKTRLYAFHSTNNTASPRKKPNSGNGTPRYVSGCEHAATHLQCITERALHAMARGAACVNHGAMCIVR
jgi:hypothetical protein